MTAEPQNIAERPRQRPAATATVRVDPDTREQLHRLATADDQTIPAVIRRLVRAELIRRGQ